MIDETAANVITRARRFLASDTSHGKRRRSGAGKLLALLLLPLLLGVMACLPVPVGDPEKSRIDPALTGAWAVSDSDGGYLFMVLDPYDKRTWLLSMIGLSATPVEQTGAPAAAQDGEDIDVASQRPPFRAADADRFRVVEVSLYKCWLRKIGGETFMTWESKNLAETAPGEKPEQWLVYRLRKTADDIFYLDSFNYQIDGLDKVTTTKQAEKIIRRHVDDPDFFNDEDAPRLERLQPADFKALQGLLKDFGISDDM